MAYTTVTVLRNDPLPDGRPGRHLQLQFTGNAGEPAKTREVDVTSQTQAKAFAADVQAQLNAALTAGTDVTLQPNQVIDTTPAASPGPTATEQWLADAQRLTRAAAVLDAITKRGLAANATLLSNYDTLAASVNTGYTAPRGGLL
jgi:hypothetical protein